MASGFSLCRIRFWRLACAVTVLWLALFPVTLAAGAAPLDVEVKAGFDGKTKVGSWTPVQIDIRNAGAALTAEVAVRYPETQGSTEIVQYVHMPQGSWKRIVMSVPVKDMKRSIDVLVSGGPQPVKASGPLVTTQYTDLFVGVLSSDPGAASHLAALKIQGVPQVSVLTLDAGSIPEDAGAMSALDLLVFSDFDVATLTTAQLEAVKAWISAGGAALFAGGASWQKTLAPVPKDLLPVTVTGSEAIAGLPSLVAAGGREFSTAGPFTLSRAIAKSSARVVFEEKGIPLVVHGDFGRGKIAYWALDLTLAPLRGWAGNLAFWQAEISRLCPWAGAPGYREYTPTGRRNDGYMINALRNLPDFIVPAPAVLGTVLLLYITLVGPVNYFVLRRSKRLELTWITVPVLAIALTAGAYIGNFWTKGRDVFTNTISVVTLETGGFAKAQTYIGVFAPTKRSFSLTFKGNPAVVTLNNYYGPMSYAPGDSQELPVTTRIIRQENTKVEFPLTNMWSMQAVEIDENVSLEGTIAAELYPYAGGVKGKITNTTKFELTDCYLTTPRISQAVGSIKPGQTVNVDMALPMDYSTPYRRPSMLSSMMPVYSGQAGPSEADRTKMRKQQVLSAFFDADPYSSPFSSLAFTGFCAEPMTDLFEERGALSRRPYLGLVVVPLKVSYPKGPVEFPPGLAKVTGIPSTSRAPVKSGAGYYYLPDKGEVAFRIELELPGSQVESAVLHVPGNPRTGGIDGFLYNYRTGKWDPFTVTVGANQVTDLADHLSQDGVIQFKVVASGQGGVELQDPTVSFRGRVQ